MFVSNTDEKKITLVMNMTSLRIHTVKPSIHGLFQEASLVKVILSMTEIKPNVKSFHVSCQGFLEQAQGCITHLFASVSTDFTAAEADVQSSSLMNNMYHHIPRTTTIHPDNEPVPCV